MHVWTRPTDIYRRFSAVVGLGGLAQLCPFALDFGVLFTRTRSSHVGGARLYNGRLIQPERTMLIAFVLALAALVNSQSEYLFILFVWARNFYSDRYKNSKVHCTWLAIAEVHL